MITWVFVVLSFFPNQNEFFLNADGDPLGQVTEVNLSLAVLSKAFLFPRLKFIFGSSAIQALDLVDQQSITLISSPSGRQVYQVGIISTETT